MGISIECQGQVLWAPSNRVGYLFADQIKALERVVDQASGLAFYLEDSADIDPVIFQAFLQAVLRALGSTNNGPLLAMAAGCTEIAIALNAKITGAWPEAVSTQLQPIVEGARTVLQALRD